MSMSTHERVRAEHGGGVHAARAGRFVAHVATMAGVALLTVWISQVREDGREERSEQLSAEVDQLRHERDRMQALAQELAREVHDVGVEAEIAHWQLRWTEERLRRLEAESSSVVSATHREPRAKRARVVALDAGAEKFLADKVTSLVAGEGSGHAGAASGSGAEHMPVLSGSADRESGLVGVGLEPEIPSVFRHGSARTRDQALASWKRTVDEVVVEECAGRFSQAGRWRCEDERRRMLWPYTDLALECLVSGNAAPDYIPDVPLSGLPSHSVPLKRGAVVLCDGGLGNE